MVDVVMGRKKVSLARGRPPSSKKSTSVLSSAATRSIIRAHHQLHKAHAQALKDEDTVKAASIAKEIEERGGLKAYQKASITGQSATRGGDSSRVLVDWLVQEGITKSPLKDLKLRLLEVGALSTKNECSRSGIFEVERIDLNSQDPLIKQQDFMHRALPKNDTQTFDVISLSLVLNYVPDAEGRGQMLKRIKAFLRQQKPGDEYSQAQVLPALFLVLPEPCVKNSRYLTVEHLHSIMQGLGFTCSKEQLSAKLYYSLWTLRYEIVNEEVSYKKTELVSGGSRNNFCIVLR